MTTNNHPESFKGVTEADDDDDDDSHSSEESNGDDSEELEGEVPFERDSDVMELEMEINMNEDDFADEESVLNQLSSVSFGGDMHVCEGWNGYKLVGDNVDKNVHPSFQRGESATRSLHYFHTYAVFDRINLNGVSDNPSSKPIQLQKLLPSLSDISCLKETFAILISRYSFIVLLTLYYNYQNSCTSCTRTEESSEGCSVAHSPSISI